MRSQEFHVIKGQPGAEGPVLVDPAIDPAALTPVIADLRPGDRVLAGPAPSWWERWLPWHARTARALERIAAAAELEVDHRR